MNDEKVWNWFFRVAFVLSLASMGLLGWGFYELVQWVTSK